MFTQKALQLWELFLAELDNRSQTEGWILLKYKGTREKLLIR